MNQPNVIQKCKHCKRATASTLRTTLIAHYRETKDEMVRRVDAGEPFNRIREDYCIICGKASNGERCLGCTRALNLSPEAFEELMGAGPAKPRMTPREQHVYLYLEDHGESSAKEICRYLGGSLSSAQQVLYSLRRKGYAKVVRKDRSARKPTFIWDLDYRHREAVAS